MEKPTIVDLSFEKRNVENSTEILTNLTKNFLQINNDLESGVFENLKVNGATLLVGGSPLAQTTYF